MNDVRRVSNEIPGTPGADFASGLSRAFGMRSGPAGAWLAAKQIDIKRLSPTGAILATYDGRDVPGGKLHRLHDLQI